MFEADVKMGLVKGPDVDANGSSGSSYPTACCRGNDAEVGANSGRSKESHVRWRRYHLVQQGGVKRVCMVHTLRPKLSCEDVPIPGTVLALSR